MRVRILGGGWYGAHLCAGLIDRGHDVELHEIAGRLFSGASGANPARLHLGFHYPRSKITRTFSQDHYSRFMEKYGFLTAGVPVNIYAIAAGDSLVDFGNYVQTLRGEVEFITIVRPEEFGLRNVEGAVLTGERHILIDKARAHFESRLGAAVVYGIAPGKVDSPDYDLTIDATFCANDAEAIDRYEPCITGILRGQTDKAVTIMDGRFPSIFPWNETEGLSSITSALLTPISKCSTWTEAQAVLRDYSRRDARDRVHAMIQQMRHFWPDAVNLYAYDGYRLGVRAMPKSAADARLVDVVRVGERALRVRAGKIDAVLHAESVIMEMIGA